MAGPNTPFFYRSGGGSSSSGSGGTGKNYLTAYKASTGSGAANTGNGDLELGATTGFSLGNVGTLTNGIPTGTTPTFGSGANGNLSLAMASTSTLGGLYSIDMISAAATTVGDCIATSAFNIDAEDQAKVLSFKIAYKAQTNPTNGNWSGTSSNSYGVAVWDATNSVFLGVQGQFNIVQSSGIGYATGTVQTGSTTASMRLIIYNVSASSGAITLRTDDWSIGPQTVQNAPAMSDWVAYTPTFGAGFGTAASINVFSRRVGDSLEVAGEFTTGTVAASAATVTLGYNGANANVTLDTSKLGTATCIIGTAQSSLTSTTYFGVYPIAPTANGTSFNFAAQSSTLGLGSGAQNGNIIAATGSKFSFFVSVPIVGWSSNSVSSSDTDTRVVAARMTGATATVTGSYSDVTWTTIANDTHGAMGAISYTVQVTGYYDIAGALNVGAATVSAAGGFFVGLNTGSVILENEFLFDLNVPENESIPFFYGSVLLNAGATFKIQIKTSGTIGTPVINSSATLNFMAVKRLSGPAVITATESVNARYFASSSTPGNSGAPNAITYTTKDYDSHNAYSAGTYTIPVTGKYEITASLYQTATTTAISQAYVIDILKNGTAVSFFEGYFISATAKPVTTLISDQLSCNAGDTITIKAGNDATTPAVSASNLANYFTIARVGN